MVRWRVVDRLNDSLPNMAVWTWLRMKKERHHPFRLRDMEEEEEEFTHHYCSMVEAIMIFTDTL